MTFLDIFKALAISTAGCLDQPRTHALPNPVEQLQSKAIEQRHQDLVVLRLASTASIGDTSIKVHGNCSMWPAGKTLGISSTEYPQPPDETETEVTAKHHGTGNGFEKTRINVTGTT
eukprot:2961063-Amphidinium_carterae.1